MIQMSLFKNFKKTSSAKSELLEFMYCSLWIMSISLAACSSYMARNWFMVGILWFLLAIPSGWWAIQQPWILKRTPLFRRCIVALVMFFVPYFILILIGITRMSSEEIIVKKHYAFSREAFMADQDGFPFIKEFALKHYGLQVALSSIPYPGAALMVVRPGYCDMSFNTSVVLQEYNGDNPSAWKKGIMAHELAHCLDIYRDMPSFKSREIGTRSIAPSESTKVVDLESYLKAETSAPTPLWREAFADAFSVGFFRMTETEGADQLVAELLKTRTTGKDTSHATGCWIQHAARTDLPPTPADLMQWADEVRSQAGCVL